MFNMFSELRPCLDELKKLAEKYHGQNYERIGATFEKTNLTETDERGVDFIDKIEEAKGAIIMLEMLLDNLKEKQNRVINPTFDTEDESLKKQVEEANHEITAIAAKINVNLKRLKQSSEQTEQDIIENGHSCNVSAKKVMIRMKEAHYNALTRKFKDTMSSYSKIQEDYRVILLKGHLRSFLGQNMQF